MPEVKKSKPQTDNDLGTLTFEQTNCSVNIPKTTEVGIFKVSDSARVPKYGTLKSGCFDLFTDYCGIDKVTVYDEMNVEIQRSVRRHSEVNNMLGVLLNPGDRAIIPTNLIFDIPEGFVMKLYSRSGISIKNGITLSNCVGYIDEDYVEPVFILISNTTAIKQHICQDSRLVQAEIVEYNQHSFKELVDKPKLKTDRKGGLGHTGKGA